MLEHAREVNESHLVGLLPQAEGGEAEGGDIGVAVVEELNFDRPSLSDERG